MGKIYLDDENSYAVDDLELKFFIENHQFHVHSLSLFMNVIKIQFRLGEISPANFHKFN